MRHEFKNTELWHSRGYLPHYYASYKYQFITYRLADSLPQDVFQRIKRESLSNDASHEKRKEIESYLDNGYGSCVLQNPVVAMIVIENWQHFDRRFYDLIAYVVMPNHVHLLIKTYENKDLDEIVHSWKSYTSKRINGVIQKEESKVWQAEYWDRFIRDERHFINAREYIHNNPVKAGLVDYADQWPWSSLRFFPGSAGGPPA